MENPGDQLVKTMASTTLSSGDLKAGPDVDHQVQPGSSLAVGAQEPTAPTGWPPSGYFEDVSSDEWEDEVELEDEDDYEDVSDDERYEAYLLAAAHGFPPGSAPAGFPTSAAQVAAILNPVAVGNLSSLPTYNDSIEGAAGGAGAGASAAAAATTTKLAALSLGAQAHAEMLRFRHKFGTSAWNESDAEELNRVYRNGPTYNNHHNWVEAKNLLNLYKSARAMELPATAAEGQGEEAAGGGTAEPEPEANNNK